MKKTKKVLPLITASFCKKCNRTTTKTLTKFKNKDPEKPCLEFYRCNICGEDSKK